MKTLIKNTLYASCLALSFGLGSCVDDAEISGQATAGQVSVSTTAQQALIDGLSAFMVENSILDSDSYDHIDWGYPCQMFFREIFGEDFPIHNADYNYLRFWEQCTYMPTFSYCTFYYYYALVKNANGLISTIDPETASDESMQYLGMALAYRALAYMDMARMYEYKRTGVAALDGEAESNGIYGLTVPIVKETTTREEAKHNPRAPFYTMYRFIMDDLRRAETYLEGYRRGNNKSYADQSVAQGLQARMWLEMGTRFLNASEDLTTQLSHESDDDGYAALGIASAEDCFRNAVSAAQKAMSGYAPVTKSQWYDTQTGFNTANQAWMWAAVVGTKEQINYYYYYTFLGQISSEPSWGMPQYGNAFRCISDFLFNKIGDCDWRKRSWVAPEDVWAENDNTAAIEAKQSKYETSLTADGWKSIPAYANLKFRPGSGNLSDYNVGLICDIPLMRVEEMYFIEIEAQARLNGWAAGASALEAFMNSYRCEGGSYVCPAVGPNTFLEEMMVQKRIEFWGEGILFFDYKRLNKAVTRSDTNYLSQYQLDSNAGYVARWMNYYIPQAEQNSNDKIILNPDPSL